MTKQQHIQLWKTFLTRKTKQYGPALYKVLRDQIKHFAATGDAMSIPMQPLYDVLRDLYTNTGRLWAWQTYSGVMKQAKTKTKAAPLGINQEFIDAILDYFRYRLVERVNNITDTTRQWLIETITKGQAEGLSYDEVIKQIMANTDIPRFRAERISRTENMIASNYAEQLGVDKTGLATNKEWIAVEDNRTRHPHRLVDGQQRPDGEPFNVGGYAMMRPGSDKTADGLKVPADLIINCRCTCGRHVLRDENGLPIRKQTLMHI